MWGEIFNIAGGPRCRIIYRDYLDKMMDLFGLGTNLLPAESFSRNDFHCGFMDTNKSQTILKYQTYTLEDYFNEVKKKVKVSRLMNRMFFLIVRPVARNILLGKSPYYKSYSLTH